MPIFPRGCNEQLDFQPKISFPLELNEECLQAACCLTQLSS